MGLVRRAAVTENFCLKFVLFPFDIFREAVCSSLATCSFGRCILAQLCRNEQILSYQSSQIFQSSVGILLPRN